MAQVNSSAEYKRLSDFRNQTQINNDQIQSKSVDTQGAQGGSKSDD